MEDATAKLQPFGLEVLPRGVIPLEACWGDVFPKGSVGVQAWECIIFGVWPRACSHSLFNDLQSGHSKKK